MGLKPRRAASPVRVEHGAERVAVHRLIAYADICHITYVAAGAVVRQDLDPVCGVVGQCDLFARIGAVVLFDQRLEIRRTD